MSEREPLSLRVTDTGVEVIEGDCPHCGHRAQEHWSDGCQGGRGGHDHCRMDDWKFKRLIEAATHAAHLAAQRPTPAPTEETP